MLTADQSCTDGLIRVSQIVPRSIRVDRNSDVLSDSCDSVCRAEIADLVVGAL